ncbi:MAG: hypothetical protein SGPRY_006252 [Prymnesium sp.]
MGKRGQNVWTDGNDEAALSRGIFDTYTTTNLRYSQVGEKDPSVVTNSKLFQTRRTAAAVFVQVAPLDMFTEANTKTNLPAQIEILATEGNEYSFQFMAKGGGSANKTFLFQQTKALLNEEKLASFFIPIRASLACANYGWDGECGPSCSQAAFMAEKIATLGTAACPPYHLAVVIGGLSAEMTLKTVKNASTRYLDSLPTSGSPTGRAFRDLEMEVQASTCQADGQTDRA